MVALRLDWAFSSGCCGQAADVGRFLASLFPVSPNLALPVSVFNLLELKKNDFGHPPPAIPSGLFTVLLYMEASSQKAILSFTPSF